MEPSVRDKSLILTSNLGSQCTAQTRV